MRILITGAHGFVGSAFAKYLSGKCDNELFFTDLHSSSSQFKNNYFECNLSDIKATKNITKEIKPNQIYHLAGTFSNNYDIDFASNYLGTKNLFDASLSLKQKVRFLLIGSAAEYGNVPEKDNPINENYPLLPTSIYGLTKSLQTLLMRYYFHQYSVNIVMARIFNILGQGASDQLFIGHLYNQINQYKNQKIDSIEVGNLESKRDYIRIDEACYYLHKLMIQGKAGDEYNVGSGNPIKINDLMNQILKDESLIDIKITHSASGKKTLTSYSCADISKLLNLINSTS
jgi:GDP-4-dehydro-6-deoxy-D-mannose reductase